MAGHSKKKKHGIQLQDKILIATTFLIGVVAGWYLYITAFAPQFNDLVGKTEAIYEDLVVVGDQYGGRRLGTTPSFQVLKDGSFNYVAPGPDDVAAERHLDGSVPRALWSEVRTALNQSKVAELAESINPTGDCASASDGIDYTYEITLKGTVYTLDTCTTNLAHDAATKATLDKLWNYFATLP